MSVRLSTIWFCGGLWLLIDAILYIGSNLSTEIMLEDVGMLTAFCLCVTMLSERRKS